MGRILGRVRNAISGIAGRLSGGRVGRRQITYSSRGAGSTSRSGT
jgi:hypothetical protein